MMSTDTARTPRSVGVREREHTGRQHSGILHDGQRERHAGSGAHDEENAAAMAAARTNKLYCARREFPKREAADQSAYTRRR